jgi:hypothetical protein
VPAHNRSVASELDLSEAMVRALRFVQREHVANTSVPALVRRALAGRGLFSDGGCLTEAGRAACARLFPGVEKGGAS